MYTVAQPMTHECIYTIVQLMVHGDLHHFSWCTIHSAWGNYIVVQPMTHEYTIVQPMVHERCIPLHNPWSMGICTILTGVQLMVHGVPKLLYTP